MSAEKEESQVEMEVDTEGDEDNKNSKAAASLAADGVPKETENENANHEKLDGGNITAPEDKSDDNDETPISGKKRLRSPTESKEGEGDTSKKREAIVAMLEVKKVECSVASAKDSTAASSTRDREKISVASIAAASQLSSAMGWNGLGSLLSLSLLTNNGNSGTSSSSRRMAPSTETSSTKNGRLPSKDQVIQASIKAVNDAPPFVHLSKTDSAPQLKITDSICAVSTEGSPISTDHTANDTANDTTAADETIKPAPAASSSAAPAPILVNDRLACKQGEGEMRGYRMTRSSHGVTPGSGNFYYEVVILQPPTARELVKSLPPNVRLGKKLQREMEKALREEEEAERENKCANETAGDEETQKSKPIDKMSSSFGAHVRLGWGMRTGDLQAPVGYDKWSYGIRDIQGSKIHCSRRDDNWGGEEFGPGDVVGCAISMVSDGNEDSGETTATSANDSSKAATENNNDDQQQQPRANENHIRFFKNGLPMGEFVITKGKRSGGAAFIITDGVYYPAISLYMGATVKVNFGPHFIHPPRKLPTGMFKSSKKKGVFQPVSNLCKVPLSAEEASAKVVKEQKTLFFRKTDNTAQQKRFLELVETEVKIQREAYQNHRRKHVLDVIEERKKRKLKCDDLEADEYFAAASVSGGGGDKNSNASS